MFVPRIEFIPFETFDFFCLCIRGQRHQRCTAPTRRQRAPFSGASISAARRYSLDNPGRRRRRPHRTAVSFYRLTLHLGRPNTRYAKSARHTDHRVVTEADVAPGRDRSGTAIEHGDGSTAVMAETVEHGVERRDSRARRGTHGSRRIRFASGVTSGRGGQDRI